MIKKPVLDASFGAVIFMLVFLSTGCSTAPPPRKQLIREARKIKLPAYPTRKKGMVYIVRTGDIGGGYSYDVYIDNPRNSKNFAGFNRGKQYIYFYLSPGRHRIFSHADNGAWIDVESKAGEVYFIQQIARTGLLRGYVSLKFIDIYNGKWWVKNLKKGNMKRTSF